MHNEIEAKISVDDFRPIRAMLRSWGAQRLGRVLETNFYFDFSDGSLRSEDRGLRIRKARSLDDGRTDQTETTVTYKGPRQQSHLKVRRELEFHADDGDAMAALFEALGMVNTLTFEKRRESWKLDRCAVELDELPGIGLFIEIEGPDGAAVASVIEKLTLQDLPMELEPYVALLQSHFSADDQGDWIRFE